MRPPLSLSLPVAAHVSRVFCSLALVLLVVHVVFILLFGFKSPVKVFATVAYTCLMIAGILNVFGATTYLSLTAYLGGWVGWGVVLTLLSGVMQNIAAIIMIVPIQQGRVEYTTT
ncbi:hypothetical protein BaRGS_00015251 [Batillaria attramentaria]|uniref:Uncharacterized protein n=1 Tax=Batillaria attramentaria TaxID=370345 RepID=A0ABD0L339_9CAEN